MHTLFLGFFICVLFPPIATQFFTGPVPAYSYYVSRLNLNCSGRTDTLHNGTTTYDNKIDLTKATYCVIAIVTSFANNSIATKTQRSGTYLSNTYRNFAIHQCNFSTGIDIGYGNCIPYYYQTAASIQLCICSTNYCSNNYTSCQASVNQALSSPPPLLPVLQPPLSSTTTCQDYYASYTAALNITPPIYTGCSLLLGDQDVSKCATYIVNHAAICAVFYISQQRFSYQIALIEGSYEVYIDYMINATLAIRFNSPLGYQYQTSGSIAVIWPDNSGEYYTGMCLCTTNNCNVNFATCTIGMNISTYPLTYNGSTSTTASTISASQLNITTLQSLATTSVTTSIVTSGISVRDNTSLPSNGTSDSLSEKLSYFK